MYEIRHDSEASEKTAIGRVVQRVCLSVVDAVLSQQLDGRERRPKRGYAHDVLILCCCSTDGICAVI